MLNILFIITGLETGGAEMMLYKILRGLDRQKFNPVVISLTTKGKMSGPIEALGVPVLALRLCAKFPNPFLFLRLIRLIRQYKPHIVHTWMYHADLIGGIVAYLAGVRRIFWCLRAGEFPQKNTKKSMKYILKLCAKLSYRIPHTIVACSERGRAVHINQGYCPSKITVIPNGFDLKQFKPDKFAKLNLCQNLKISKDVMLVGLIARFDPMKNHLSFIKIAEKVVQILPQVRFVLVGKGVDESNTKLIDAIEASKLRDRFFLLGLQQDIVSIVAAFDLLVLPSLYGEGFPNVLGEAMACEVPCAVTDVGDAAAIVADTGYVVSVNNISDLVRGITKILTLTPHEKASLCKAARQRIARLYGIDNVVRLYENLYLGAVNNN